MARNLADPATRLNRFFTSLESVAALVAPVAEQQASLFANLDTTFSALATVARPFIAGLDRGRSAGAGGGDQGPAAAERVPRQQRRPLPRSAAGRRRAADRRAAARRRARGRHADAQARHARSTSRLIPTFQQLQAFAQDPLVPLGLKSLTQTVSAAEPDAGEPHPGADHLQLPDAVLPQRRLAAQRGRRQRHLAALHHHRHAAGPEQRGRPVLRARQRAHAGQPPAHQPVPQHGLAGPAQGVRGGQRDSTPPARP